MAQYQEKPLRSLCSPTTHPGHPSTLRNPSRCPFHHPLTPSREHPASPPSPSSCPCLSILLFLLPLPPSRVHPALGDREMSLSSRHLAPCIPPRPRILRVLSALGRSREVSRTREWMQGDALGTIVLSDRARRSKQDRLSPWRPRMRREGPPSPRQPVPRECSSIPVGSPAPPGSAGLPRCCPVRAVLCRLPGRHRTLGTGHVGEARGAREGDAPPETPPLPPQPRARPGAPVRHRAAPPELRLLRLPRLRHLLVLLLGLLQHLRVGAEGPSARDRVLPPAEPAWALNQLGDRDRTVFSMSRQPQLHHDPEPDHAILSGITGSLPGLHEGHTPHGGHPVGRWGWSTDDINEDFPPLHLGSPQF